MSNTAPSTGGRERIAQAIAAAAYELRRGAVERLYHRGLGPLRFRVAARRLRKRMRQIAAQPSAGRIVTRRTALAVVLRVGNDRDRTIYCLDRLFAASERQVELRILSEADPSEMERVISTLPAQWRDNVRVVTSYADASSQNNASSVLLMSDSIAIASESIEVACDLVERQDGTGGVVPRLQFPHGGLVSAGGIMVNGQALPYERWSPSGSPTAMFRREVNYGSTGLLLLSSEAFSSVAHALDESRAAEQETAGVKACARLRELGYQIIYEPTFSGVYLGSSIPRNERRHSSPPPAAMLAARDCRPVRGRILFLEDRVPHEWLGAGFPRSKAMVEALLELGYFVTFYPTADVPEWWDDMYKTLDRRVEVMLDAGRRGLRRFLRSRSGYYDACIVTRPHNMRAVKPLLSRLRAEGEQMRVIYDAEALFVLRELAERRLRGEAVSDAEAARAVQNEISLADGTDAIMTVSEHEANHFREYGSSRRQPPIYVLSHQTPPSLTPAAFEDRTGFLFIGALQYPQSPNVDSLRWFLDGVWPLLQATLNCSPKLRVVGINYTDWSLDGIEGVEYLGPKDDLHAVYNSARVLIAPTRFAAGVPQKLFSAAAAGLPIVATSLLATQVGWNDRTHLRVADGVQDFAAACAELYSDPVLWARIREAAFQRICDDSSAGRFRRDLEAAVSPPRSAELTQPQHVRAFELGDAVLSQAVAPK